MFIKITKDLLPQVKDKYPFLYFEHGKIEIDDMSVKFISAEKFIVKIPCGLITCLILGPGTSLTHEVIKILAQYNCFIFWMGENMLRFYSTGISITNHTKNIYKQIDNYSNKQKRLNIVKYMLSERFPEIDLENKTINQLRGMEGIRVKQLYKELANEYNVFWNFRNTGNLSSFQQISPINKYITIFNQFLYAYVTSVILALGYSPYIGFLHKGSPLPLTYDIADMFKKEMSIIPAFSLTQYNKDFNLDFAITEFLLNAENLKINKKIPEQINKIFNLNICKDETFLTEQDELLNNENQILEDFFNDCDFSK